MNKIRKDIFIDNNIAKNFANPADPEYKKLIKWLLKFDKNIDFEQNAQLVLSQKIINEYFESSGGAKSVSNIVVIVNILTKQGRINEFTSKEIKDFQKKYYTAQIIKRFKNFRLDNQNNKDRNHLPIILMSDRKKALIIDDKFYKTVNDFPKFNAQAEKKPREEFYK